ncbi:VTT domain-containing protein [Dactylosporangium sp. NBC_01737]|nr:VTT domain-containing protein [Dactylosporangium sp. NBC_01737]
MRDLVESVAATPWVVLVVFVVAALDAVVPLSPSESTLIAVAVVSAQTGRPSIWLVVVAAAAGAFAGDVVSFRIGVRAGAGVLRRLRTRRRGLQVYGWARRTLTDRGGQVLVFARYLPGGRSASALAAGVVGYPAGRFQAWTALGVSVWAGMAGMIGYSCGRFLDGRPWQALLLAYAGAASLLVVAEVLRRLTSRDADEEIDPGPARGDGEREGRLLQHDHAAAGTDLADHPELETGGAQLGGGLGGRLPGEVGHEGQADRREVHCGTPSDAYTDKRHPGPS